MRYCLILLLVIFCWSQHASAHVPRHKHRGPELPQSEVELMTRVMQCLNNKDTFAYYSLFPSFDTLWHLVMHNADVSAETQQQLNELREHPQKLLNFDPYYNPAIIWQFCHVLEKGEDSGIRWNGIVLQRYELHKQGISRNDIGLDKVIPERFEGFVFVRDMLSSTTYCITIDEIQKVNGYYFGGQLHNILQSTNMEEFYRREREENAYFEKKRLDDLKAQRDAAIKDSLEALGINTDTADTKKDTTDVPPKPKAPKKDPLVASPAPDEDTNNTKKEIVNRKYYEGKFDEEIPVKLYVRYMKDSKKGMVIYWDALYKFGDQVDYVKLNVSKSPEGKWLFEEPIASMELDLTNKHYSGDWINNDNQTGYDVQMDESPLSQPMMDKLDQILDKGLWGKTDESKTIPEKPKEPTKEDDDRGND